MKTRIGNISGCGRTIDIEVCGEELEQEFDRVYADIRKSARIPGFRPGRAPRDLLEAKFAKRAEEEVVKRAIPEYYLKALKEEKLAPVAPPEINNVQFKNHTLHFRAKIDVRPQVRLKGNYRQLRIIKKKVKIEQAQIDRMVENLRESRAKEKIKPEPNDAFAKDLGFQTLDELKQAIDKNLQANAEAEVRADMERQILDQLLKRASLDVPGSLLNSQTQELINQLKLNQTLQREKKEGGEHPSEKELEAEAGKEAVRRIRLSFILEKIAQQENIQVNEEDSEKRIEAISQRSAKSKDEVRQYLDRHNLIPQLSAELRDKKTIEFLLREAKIKEE